MTTLHCLARLARQNRERLRGVLPQDCVERDDGGRRDLLAPSIEEARLPEQPEHTQTSRETCGDCGRRGAAAWAGGRATCDELEMRQGRPRLRTPAASWYAVTDLELPQTDSFSEDA